MKAPSFSLQDQSGNVHTLSDYVGKWIVLYFYPKDMTPGCTVEACSFRDNYGALQKRGVAVLGVSKDSVKSHQKFMEKHDLPFPLLADTELELTKAIGAYGQKKFMGRIFAGILRNTYLINPEGEIVKVYESVKPKVHVDEIMRDLDVLQGIA